MINIFQLPFTFDPAALQADLARIGPDEWVPHYNTSAYEGSWSGVALRSVGGHANIIYAFPAPQEQFKNSEIVERCPSFRQVLETLHCPLTSVRLLRLDAGSSILEHSDDALGYEDGEVRLHVPIVTDPAVTFYLSGEPIPMQVGECWYLNLTLPHRVDNHSTVDRVHMVIDCKVNDWLTSIFPAENELNMEHGA